MDKYGDNSVINDMMNNPYGDNSILGGPKMCLCALPALNGGDTRCCKHCANNTWKFDEMKKQWDEFNKQWKDGWDPYKGRMEIEYDENGHIKKIIYYN